MRFSKQTQLEAQRLIETWIIQDWTGKRCFTEMTFDSFEDAWGFLYETFPNGDDDQTFDDYFVVPEEHPL